LSIELLNELQSFHEAILKKSYSEIQQSESNILYHYTNIEALNGILSTGSFMVSKSSFLKDPSEVSFVKDIIRDIGIEFMDEAEINKMDFYNSLIKSMDELQQLFPLYILSLTEEQDSLVLWSSYSDFEGYNIGIDIKNINFSKDLFCLSGKVIYDKDTQKEMIKEIIFDLYTLYKKYETLKCKEYFIETEKTLLLNIYTRAMFFKRYGFKDEREYRIVFTIKGTNTVLIEHKICNGCFIPYLKIPLKCLDGENRGKFPLKNITIGPKNNLDIAEHGLKSFLYSQGYKDIEVYKSSIMLRY
jgi:hypothetical protein